MIDVSQPRSPGWWLAKLMGGLQSRSPRLTALDNYYRGRQPLPWVSTADQAEAFRTFQRKARTNFSELVVEAVRERMTPVGFTTGVSDQEADAEAWRFWEANGLSAAMPQLLRAKLSMSIAYMMVGGVDPDLGAPLITPEDPRQVITYPDPSNPRRQLAGLKVWSDDLDSVDLAYLYLPGFLFRAVRSRPQGEPMRFDPAGWSWLDDGQRVPGPVPIVPFPNRADLFGNTLGEFEDVVDVLDRINLTILQRLVIAALQAHRQRAVKGAPDKDAAGNDIDYGSIFTSDPGAMWQLPAGVDLWESAQVDLSPLLASVRHDIQDLAAITRTPLFYLTPDAANGSAEGASLAREGLVFKAEDRIVETSDPLEQVMSLAFLFAGDEARATRSNIEVLWAPAERFSLEGRADAASKAAATRSRRGILSDIWGLSPQETQREMAETAAEALVSDAVA